MNLVFFAHPSFLSSASMPRFLSMLVEGFKERGHKVEVVAPKARMFNIPSPLPLKKWLGYIDQYVIFPFEIRRQLKKYPVKTLFVFTDNALGPWVPIVKDKMHVIHCHDFMAQRSAMGEVDENPTAWSGKIYQQYIRDGYSKGKNFISVSVKTMNDLHYFLRATPTLSTIVYNGLNYQYKQLDPVEARRIVSLQSKIPLASGYLLHVGGNQWYKNRKGVIELYNAWREIYGIEKKLLLIGEPPNEEVQDVYQHSYYRNDIHFLSGWSNKQVNNAYSGALVFLFPSLAEGFGWPIAEAMACGCPVITTDEAPMTEVAGTAAFFISRMPTHKLEGAAWAQQSAISIQKIITSTNEERKQIIDKCLLNAERFDPVKALDAIEKIYSDIVQ